MKNIKNKIAVAPLLLCGCLAQTSMAFAEPLPNPYGIVYSGGEELGANNITIDSELVDGLTPLIVKSFSGDTHVTFSDSDQWEDGYFSTDANVPGSCSKVKLFKVYGNTTFSDLNFNISNERYTAKISIDKVAISDASEVLGEDDYFTIGVYQKTGGIATGYTNRILNEEDTTCSEKADAEHNRTLSIDNDAEVFLETTIKLYDNQTNNVFVSNELYFGIIDFDFAQSFKILNTNDLLSSRNMYAKSAESLQPDNPDITLKNMFVSNGNYIYSEYDPGDEVEYHRFDTNDTSNIYVSISQGTQRDGLKLVYGYGGYAASNLGYYAKQYTVTYDSDEGGRITGQESEQVISGLNPLGSEQTDNDNYDFLYWIADKDITLNDGTEIEAGEEITSTQIPQIIVSEDITLTAIHEQASVNPDEEPNEEPDAESDEEAKPVPVPNTGHYTGGTNATIISFSILGIMSIAFIIALIPKLNHKKIGFKKH